MSKFINYRDRAIAWLNSDRDFHKGIALLEESQFKPGVVRKLRMDGASGQASAQRLYHLIMQLVNAWSMTEQQLNDNTDPVTGIPADERAITDTTKDKRFTQIVLEAENNEKVEPRIRELITRYANAYRQRDKLHRQLASMAEDNDEKTMQQRKMLIGLIDQFTEVMELCYPAIEKYINLGIASEEEIKRADQKVEVEISEQYEFDNMSLDELKKFHKNLKIRIIRTRNMLEYQQDAKAEKPNPLPQSPRRLRYEERLKRFKKQLEVVEYTIEKKNAHAAR